ncbi:MAG: lysophospholipid acyltransferase family protein [Hyphomicrobiaceae bacterium]
MSPKPLRTGSPARGATRLAAFAALTVPLMPVQALLKRTSAPAARRFPHWYHRQVCRLLGIRLHVEGHVVQRKPVLLIANHTSWLDIPVLSALAPVSFVAKKEVGGWPGVSALARLQRTVFVDRERKASAGDTAGEMLERLVSGDTLVLFAEGTSSDGNRVLPFKTSLFAAAKPSRAGRRGGSGGTDAGSADVDSGILVQTVAIAYTHLHGVPLGRADRHLTGWYGDMDMAPHAWELLKAGPLDVAIKVGTPVPLEAFADRKALARHAESQVRAALLALLHGGQRTVPERPPATTVRQENDSPPLDASPRSD